MVYSCGMESAPRVDSALCLSAPPVSYPRVSVKMPRQAHPLKEDDRLEATRAPANGCLLLASIGIKRNPAVGPHTVEQGCASEVEK